MSDWFYDNKGTQAGPVSKEALQAKLTFGELDPST